MRRLVRGLAAALALALGLVGLPLALAQLGGNPLPAHLDWVAVRDALLTPDDGSVLFGVVTVVGWVAWGVFAISVVAEVIALASRQRIRIQLPGLFRVQRLAAGLLVAVVAVLSSPHLGHAPPPGGPASATPAVAYEKPVASPAPIVASASAPNEAAAETAPIAASHGHAQSSGTRHRVVPGDDLWSLAEHYYGQGREWRTIAAANPHLLSGGPDRLQPGWELDIPQRAKASGEGSRDAGPHVEVRPGDSLHSIAERELGSAQDWPRLWKLNRHQLDDPNNLVPGMQLELPRPHTSPKPDVEPDVFGPSVRDVDTDPASASSIDDDDHVVDSDPDTPPDLAPPGVGDQDSVPRIIDQGAPVEGPVDGVDGSGLALPLVGVGGLMAAGLVAGLRWRRRLQLQERPVGRRILHPPPAAQAVETAMGRRQQPLTLRSLDRAMRAIAAHCRTTAEPLPELLFALVGAEEIELVFRRTSSNAPLGFTVRGRSWVLNPSDAGYLATVPGLAEAGRPWPALVTLGRDQQGRSIVADLEALGILGISAASHADREAILTAMVVELSFSPWADELIVTVVGDLAGLPDALGKHNVTRTDDLAAVTERLERRAAVQREQPPEAFRGERRIDSDLADPWAPEIVLINREVSPVERSRLRGVILAEPAVTTAVVLAGSDAPWSMDLTPSAGGVSASLVPAGVTFVPQRLDSDTASSVTSLVAITGSPSTTPAPWWEPDSPPEDPPERGVPPEGGSAKWGTTARERKEGGSMKLELVADVDHPTLQLLGPVQLVGAGGDPPARAEKQCLEYCAWLLEHPGTTAQAMANALAVAETTRRSNMSRLRGWLGGDADGNPFLPDAYTGRIFLHEAVTSDWQHLQVLTVGGVNRASVESLEAGLHLVRGAPLADAAPGQWHWAEELRTDMISCVRDLGVELADRALESGQIDLARWAASRALAAAPADELLMATRIRTEHRAGNVRETERLTLQLAAQARALGMDLDARTVILLQEVMEGRVRARMV